MGWEQVEYFLFDEERTVDDQPVIARAGEADHEFKVEIGFLELEVVAYVGAVRIVGYAHFGISGRATSRRASDYLRHYADTKLTLSRARVSRVADGAVLDEAPFLVLNLDRIDVMYARDLEGTEAGKPAQAAADPA